MSGCGREVDMVVNIGDVIGRTVIGSSFEADDCGNPFSSQLASQPELS